jgi:hypothetical protein
MKTVFYTKISDFFKANFPNIKIAAEAQNGDKIQKEAASKLAEIVAKGKPSEQTEEQTDWETIFK